MSLKKENRGLEFMVDNSIIKEKIKILKKNVLDIMENHNENDFKIEINCNVKNKNVKISITEYNL